MPVKKQHALASNNVDVKFTVLICILLIAAIFRFFNLTSSPPGVFQDEAVNTMDALQRPGQVFYQANNGREGLFMNLIALSFYLLGPSIFSLRIVSAIIGILTVLGVYLFSKQLFKKDFIALMASFFCAISFWHVNFSRISFRVIMLPFVLVFLMHFLLKALDKIREKADPSIEFVLAGVFYGLGFYTYTTYRVIALLIPFLIGIYWFVFVKNKKDLKVFSRGILAFICVSALTVAPLAIYFSANPADFFGRSSQVSIFSQPDPVKAGIESLFYHLGMFNVAGDCNWRHNVACMPQLSWPIGFLFLVGAIISLWIFFENISKKGKVKAKLESIFPLLVLFLCFIFALGPSILTFEGIPHALRSLPCAPFAYVLGAFGAYYLVEKIKVTKSNKKYPEFFNLLGMIFLVLVAYFEFTMYFSIWANAPEVKGAFGNSYIEMGKVLNDFDSNLNVYLIANKSNTTYEFEGMKFIEYQGKQYSYQPRYVYLTDWEKDKIKIENDSPVLSLSRLDDRRTYLMIKEKIKELLQEKQPKELTVILNFRDLGNEFLPAKENVIDLYQDIKNYNLKNLVIITNSDESILQRIKDSLSK